MPSASLLFLRNNPCGSEAVERMSERADTAYSPRVREEEHSAAVSRIIYGDVPRESLVKQPY